MKLSEAMRKGAALRPQAFEALVDDQGGMVCTCAFGAAYEGAFGRLPYDDPAEAGSDDIYAVLFDVLDTNPDDVITADPSTPHDWLLRPASGLVITLNDDRHWTREQIADWLEGIGL